MGPCRSHRCHCSGPDRVRASGTLWLTKDHSSKTTGHRHRDTVISLWSSGQVCNWIGSTINGSVGVVGYQGQSQLNLMSKLPGGVRPDRTGLSDCRYSRGWTADCRTGIGLANASGAAPGCLPASWSMAGMSCVRGPVFRFAPVKRQIRWRNGWRRLNPQSRNQPAFLPEASTAITIARLLLTVAIVICTASGASWQP